MWDRTFKFISNSFYRIELFYGKKSIWNLFVKAAPQAPFEPIWLKQQIMEKKPAASARLHLNILYFVFVDATQISNIICYWHFQQQQKELCLTPLVTDIP